MKYPMNIKNVIRSTLILNNTTKNYTTQKDYSSRNNSSETLKHPQLFIFYGGFIAPFTFFHS
jgi:hypothetical protein